MPKLTPWSPDVQPQCTAISVADGRWRVRDCEASLPTACRAQDGSSWQLGAGSRGKCPVGFAHEVPHHAKENTMLKSAVQQSQAEEAWLPIQGQQLLPLMFDGTSDTKQLD